MEPYTTNDIAYKEVLYDHRTWWPQCCTGKPSDWKYTKAKALCFYTKDGKYTTGAPDSDDCSYWREVSRPFSMGRTSTDYVFGTLVCDNLKYVTNKLNELIAR